MASYIHRIGSFFGAKKDVELNDWDSTDLVGLHIRRTHVNQKGGSLISDGARLSRLLLEAAIDGDTEDIIELVHKGVDLSESDDNGMTALHFACTYRNLNAVRTLLTYLAPVNCANRVGQTPLTVAVLHGDVQIVKCLVNAGADVNGGAHDYQMPLYHAIRLKKDSVAVLLVMAGAWLDDEKLHRVAHGEEAANRWKCMFSATHSEH